MNKYIKLIRVKHWIKNGLIFLPLFFNSSLFDVEKLLYCFITFLVFSFISSIIYIINDINDIESDRLHPIKKKRPLASGEISIKQSISILIILALLALATTTVLYNYCKNIFVFIIPIIYIILNFLYSKGLKNKPIIDVIILVSGFVFRVMFGGVVLNILVSKWLYLIIIFGSFYLGFGKRRNEIIKVGENSRKVLNFYNKEFLDKNMYVCLTLALTSYTFWCVDADTINRVGNDCLYWTIPLVMVIFLMYSLNIEKDSYGDPIEVILSDKLLMFISVIYIGIMFFLLYFK